MLGVGLSNGLRRLLGWGCLGCSWLRGSAVGRCRLTGCGGRSKDVILELRDIVCLLGDDHNRRAQADKIFRSGGLGDIPFFLHLEGHRSLISLYFGNGISGLNLISDLLEPLEDLAFLHGGRQRRHLLERGSTERT